MTTHNLTDPRLAAAGLPRALRSLCTDRMDDHELRDVSRALRDTMRKLLATPIPEEIGEDRAYLTLTTAMDAISDELEDRAAYSTPDPRRPKGEDVEVRAGAGEHRAFDRYLRTGQVERRAQSIGSDTAGGFTVPTEFLRELVKSMSSYGVMFTPGLCRHFETDTGRPMEVPTTNDTNNKAVILGENVADSEQDVVFGQKVVDAYKYTSRLVRVSVEALQDSAFDVEGMIRDLMAERMGRGVSEHLTVGTGAGQPEGIVTASTLGKQAASGTAVTFDEVLDLVHSVDPSYRSLPSCKFMMNDTTLLSLRKLKEATTNAYIWQPRDVAAGSPPTLLGFPYVVNPSMANIASGARSVVFGAFEKYAIRVARGFTVNRLNERYGEYHQVGFIGFGRFDGGLLDTAAVKHIVHP